MSATIDALLHDMLAWLAVGPRSYDEVMDAWRTSCPRLPVWEDANDLGYVEQAMQDRQPMVCITAAGRAFLTHCQRDSAARASAV